MIKPQFRIASMKAVADNKDRSKSAQAYVVRRLWRSHDPEVKQAARAVLNILKPERKSPKALSVARLVKAELLDQGEDWTKPHHGVLTVVYGIIADRIGLKDRTVKENFEQYRAEIPEAEAKEREALLKKLEAEAKAQTDALFYRDAAKWGDEE
jgi:hypothetical protein